VFSPPPFHPNRPHLVAPVRVDATGERGPTRAQARGPDWRRSGHGWYVPVGTDRNLVAQRIVEAAAVLRGYGGVTGWAALNWLGDHWFDGLAHDGVSQLPVPVTTGMFHVREQPGIAISEERCRPEDLISVDGLRLTTAVRSVCFEMRYARTERLAVCALDMAAFSDLVSIAELAAYATEHPGWTGIPQCRRAIPYADENCWSLRESLMRQIWERDAGLPRPLTNRPVFDRSGRHIGTPDLLDPVAGVAGDYDGALHLAGRQRARDVRREHRFRSAGLEYVVMLGADFADVASFVTRLRSSYARARFEPEPARAWTIEPPRWWIPTLTVDQRRRLDPQTRERLLRHRRAS
jgi:hypothetical protein